MEQEEFGVLAVCSRNDELFIISRRSDRLDCSCLIYVFLGPLTPESAGDYASGTNHTLPTNGYAKAYSGVSLDSFIRKITFQEIKPEGLNIIGPAIELMATNEQLDAHKNAVSVRLGQLENGNGKLKIES